MKARDYVIVILLILLASAALYFLLQSLYSKKEDVEVQRITLDVDIKKAAETMKIDRDSLCENFTTRSFNVMSNFYRKDASILTAEGELYHGKKGIEEFWKKISDSGVISIEYERISLIPLGLAVCNFSDEGKYDSAFQEIGFYKFIRNTEPYTNKKIPTITTYRHQERCPQRAVSETLYITQKDED